MEKQVRKYLILSILFFTFSLFTGLFSAKTEAETSANGANLAMLKKKKDSVAIAKKSEEQIVKEKIELLNAEIENIENSVEVFKSNCLATYYHDMFNGRLTASGSVFSNNDLTAAHKTLPFGTKVRVTNLRNNKSVIVTITDRGPYVKNKEIDLTRKAFASIGKTQRGNLKVKLEILPDNFTEVEDLIEERDMLIENHFGETIEQVSKSLEIL